MALTAPGNLVRKPGEIIEYGVKATVTVYTAANLVLNGGLVQPAAGASSLPYAGVARTGTVTASAVDGARAVDVQRSGLVKKALSGATVADIGKEVYMTDDNVITLVPNNGPPMGIVAELVSAGIVNVDITGYTALPTTGPVHIKIPFVKKTSEFDSGYDLPERLLVEKVFPEVTTEAGSSTIDIGLLASETGGDADGFVDGASCAAAGVVLPNLVDDADTKITSGVLLCEAIVKSADTSALYAGIAKPHYAGSLAARSISYTTSNHTIAGFIHVIGRMI